MVGFPLPVWVICDLLGVPDSERDRFSYWSDTLLNLTRYTQAEIDKAQEEFIAYMAGPITARRANPGDDLLSELTIGTDADADGYRLSDPELVATGQGLLVAGHETTANMIGKMVSMLLADRSLARRSPPVPPSSVAWARPTATSARSTTPTRWISAAARTRTWPSGPAHTRALARFDGPA